jgi:hypothetical protein
MFGWVIVSRLFLYTSLNFIEIKREWYVCM